MPDDPNVFVPEEDESGYYCVCPKHGKIGLDAPLINGQRWCGYCIRDMLEKHDVKIVALMGPDD